MTGFGRDRYAFGKAHNEFPDLQGGTDDEYYHLTEAEYTASQAVPATYLPLAGGTMSGDINMGSNDINTIKLVQTTRILAGGVA